METLSQAFKLVTDVLEIAAREKGEVGGCQCSLDNELELAPDAPEFEWLLWEERAAMGLTVPLPFALPAVDVCWRQKMLRHSSA